MAFAEAPAMSDARQDILSTIARTRTNRLPRPIYEAPRRDLAKPEANDLVALFSEKALAQRAQVVAIPSAGHAPFAMEVLLRDAGAPPQVHLPADSELRALPWKNAPKLQLVDTPPGEKDTALSAADFAIAETGTLVFLSGRARPASWHFLPGRAFAILSAANILPTLEDVIARVRTSGMPSTMNLISGPSCTGDIEQSVEYGAHGPKDLHVLLCDK
jgi:L-lactate dehydrogenase complex protein LldG